MKELTRILTLVQAKYWLEKGEILIFTTTDSTGYISNKEDEVEINVQPKYGLLDTYRCKKEKAYSVIESLLGMTEFYVSEGATLQYTKPTFIQKLMSIFKKK